MSPAIVNGLMWVLIGTCAGFLAGWACGRIWRGIDGRLRLSTRRGIVVLEGAK